jgi:hypothetical protein
VSYSVGRLDNWRLRSCLGDDLEIQLVASSAEDEVRDTLRELGALFFRLSSDRSPTHATLVAVVARLRGEPTASGLSRAAPGDGAARALLEELRRAGRARQLVVRRRTRRPVPLPPDPPEAVLGPESTKASELSVVLLDATGAPMPGARCRVTTPDGRRIDGELDGSGQWRLPGVLPGSCAVVWPDLGDPRRLPMTSDTPSRVVEGAIAVQRVESGKAWAVDAQVAPHVFQLRRRTVVVLELEHFSQGGVVALPGAAPADASREGAAAVRGHEALAACLDLVRDRPPEQVLVASHGAGLAKDRAACTLALLSGDRDAFVALANAKSTSEDRRRVLAWVAAARGWACDPGEQGGDDRAKAATKSAQRSYNATRPEGRGRIAVDGLFGPQTWGAVFDLWVETVGAAPLQGAKPRVASLADEHLTEPFATLDGRRAKERAVEVLLLDAPASPDDAATLYDPRESEISYHEVESVPVTPKPRVLRVRLHDRHGTPVTSSRYRLEVDTVIEGETTDGWVVYPLPPDACLTKCKLAWGRPKKDGRLPYEMEIALEAEGAGDEDAELAARLHNLGHGRDLGLSEQLRRFRIEQDIADEVADKALRARAHAFYEGNADASAS